MNVLLRAWWQCVLDLPEDKAVLIVLERIAVDARIKSFFQAAPEDWVQFGNACGTLAGELPRFQ
ncbi:MAG: hypothetical protein PHO64_07390 [Thiomonas sp.]|nr:hypothetical protein [Thiomonas sp.]